MPDIDFLPAEYRQRHARNRHTTWRLGLLGAGVAVFALAAVGQLVRRQHVRAELDMIEPVHAALVAQSKQLAGLQTHLQTARATAELVTYLRHPWPRTRILDEVLRPLPEELTLDRVAIDRESPETRGGQPRLSRAQEQAEAAKAAALAPALRDLKRLRDETDPMRTVVSIVGTTSDNAALHRYLAVLEKNPMFSKVELVDVEGSEGRAGMRFSMTLVVRPGYGQPGGPAAPPKHEAARRPESMSEYPKSAKRSSLPPPGEGWGEGGGGQETRHPYPRPVSQRQREKL